MKYTSKQIVFQELPNEVTLAYSVSGCVGQCKGCHSPWLRDNVGEELTLQTLQADLEHYKNITAVLFLGGEWYEDDMIKLIHCVQQNNLKIGLYSGLSENTFKNKHMKIYNQKLDYLKLGEYIAELGGLNSSTTNQVLLKKIGDEFVKINLKGERI